MGGQPSQKQTQNQSQSVNAGPWAPAQPYLTQTLGQIAPFIGNSANLTPGQSSALNILEAQSGGLSRYAPTLNNIANTYLQGGETGQILGFARNTLQDAQSRLAPYTTMDTNPYSNPAFKALTDTLQSDISNQINSQYAGAGYSPVRTGDYAQTLGRGIAQGVAPTFLNAYQTLEGLKTGAINNLYGYGNTTAGILGNLLNQKLQFQQAGSQFGQQGINAEQMPYMQQLQLEAQRRGIPISNISDVAQLLLPIAQTGQSGTTTGYGQGSASLSLPLWQQILGGVSMGLGALGGAKNNGLALPFGL